MDAIPFSPHLKPKSMSDYILAKVLTPLKIRSEFTYKDGSNWQVTDIVNEVAFRAKPFFITSENKESLFTVHPVTAEVSKNR